MKALRMLVPWCVTLLLALSQGKSVAADARSISFSMKYTVVPQPRSNKVILTALVPRTLEGKQKIDKIVYTPRPEKVFDENGNRYARFVFESLQAPIDIVVNVEGELYRHDLSVLKGKKAKAEVFQAGQWLEHEKYQEKDAREIQEAARQIHGKDHLDAARNIQDYLRTSLKYTGYNAKDLGALRALKDKGGDCNEYTDLFVALCRAKNIRARSCEGYITSQVRQGDTPKHDWVEFYTREYGWVPLDPLHSALGSASFEKMGTFYIYLSNVRNDKILNQYHFFVFNYFGKPVEVKDSFIIHKQADLLPR